MDCKTLLRRRFRFVGRIGSALIAWFLLTAAGAISHAANSPQVHVAIQGSNIVIDWPSEAPCYWVESTTNLFAGLWVSNAASPSVVNDRLQLTYSANETARYFRLRRPPAPPPSAAVLVNGDLGTPGDGSGAEWVPFEGCPTDGCTISPLLAENTNVLDATSSIDWARCSTNDPSLQFQWIVRFPQTDRSGAVYLSSRIQGRNSPILALSTNALPDLGSASKQWRVELRLTSQADTNLNTVVRFTFPYLESAMTLTDYDNELNGP